jgi:DNA gyrase subunit A
MIGFGIDEAQAEFVAEIRLRNINREYILQANRGNGELERDIADLEDMEKNRGRIRKAIVAELEGVIKKYGQPRRTQLVYETEIAEPEPEEEAEDYPVTVFISRHGYLKKITPLSLRMGGEQKYKEDDGPLVSFETSNRSELLVFTDRRQVYKTRLSEYEDSKASSMGTFLPSRLQMDEGESVLTVVNAGDYSGSLIFFFENGKAARVPVSAYATKTNRKKLANAYSDKSPLKTLLHVKSETEAAVFSTEGRALVFNTAQIPEKATRDSQGVGVMTLKQNIC